MEEEIVLPADEPDHKCGNCGKGISPTQARLSANRGQIGETYEPLCRKCHDSAERRY